MELLKLSIRFILVLFLIINYSQQINASDNLIYSIQLQKVDDDGPDEFDLGNKGQRIPVKPIMLYIYETGDVDIQDTEKEEIISYSLYNEVGESIGEVYDDNEFAELINSTSGSIQIIIKLIGYNLTGWIVL